MKYIDQFPAKKGDLPPLGEEPVVDETCKLYNVELGCYTYLAPHTSAHDVSFGDYSYTAGNVSMAYARIGKFASIANSVRINPGNHPQWRATQHHCTYRRVLYGFDSQDDHDFFRWRHEHHCLIGHDVWIGHGAIIMPGVNVGTGAIVGSGAIVTDDIPPYGIAVGVKAKVIKFRFPDRISQALQQIAWWDWDRVTLEERFKDFLQVEAFIEKYGQ